MKRFLPFLTPIIIFLVLIPILLLVELSQFAKILGLVMVLLTTFALRYWLFRANKLGKDHPKIKLNTNDRYFLNSALPIYKSMDSGARKIFEERLGRVLAELEFDNKEGKMVSRDEGLAFGSLLTCLTLNEEYKRLNGKIVVFKNEGGVQLIFQGQNPVLFVNLEEIVAELKGLSGMDNHTLNTKPLGVQLRNFNDLAVA